MIKSKKGEGIINIIFFIGILFLLLLIGVGVVFGSMIINWVFDVAAPELSGLGMVGSSNLSSISSTVLTPVNSLIQSFTWLTGIIYIMALGGCLGLSIAFRMTGNKWLMGFFIACMLMLVVASIFMSNIYEEFYNDTGDVGTRLHEHTMLSWLILESPLVFVVIGFIGGIIMFTGDTTEKTV